MSSAPILDGTTLPDVGHWSDRVVVALGQNPNAFTGPGTNTYLVGTGRSRILLDTGSGRDAYLPVLERAMQEAGCDAIQEVVVTHGHPDHLGGARSVLGHFGDLRVSKRPWPGVDEEFSVELTPIDEGDVIRTEGGTLRAIHTPGHAPDHLCFVLEEEGAVFSGDNVLGIGTTVIPVGTGSLTDYMRSLERLRSEAPSRIYPAHGPVVEAGTAKVEEYIAHRRGRERQILAVLEEGPKNVMGIVRVVYAAYPEHLYRAAAQSVTQHLQKLARDERAESDGDDEGAVWRLR